MTFNLLPLREYQLKAIDAIHRAWRIGVTRPAVVLPTGAGKTVVFAHLAEEFLKANPGKRVLILSHTDELVNQAASKMHDVAPHRSIGIVKAAQNEVHAEIVSASVQSLRNETRRNKIRNVGLVVVDEAHHATARTYRAILKHYGAFSRCYHSDTFEIRPCAGCVKGDQITQPWARVAGFTATLVRGDKEKLSDVWEEVAFKLSIAFMIRSGYLLDVKGRHVVVPKLDLKSVKQSGGDYQEGALGEALIEAMAPTVVAQKYVEHASDRKGIGFAPTVETAYLFSEAFVHAGIVSEVVHGALPRDERRAILARLKTGETQFVWSVMALTEGFDEPTVSCAVIARPTKSNGLYQQMVGRVLRPDLSLPPDERGHALILDVVGISQMHGLQSLVDLSTRDDLPKDVDEDLSLLELEDFILDEPVEEKSEGGGSEPEQWYVGPAETREFDPLGRDSTKAWGRTPDGTYYLTAGVSGYIFLNESLTGEPGTYDVVWCAKEVARGQVYPQAAMTEHRGLPFEMAIAWGEEEAVERGGFGSQTLTAKKSKWRKDPATSGQVAKVRSIPGWGGAKIRTEREEPDENGYAAVIRYWVNETGETLTKGMASEIIDGASAARAIDPLIKFVKQRAAQSEGVKS